MAVDERGRLQLAEAAKRVFGDEAGITLMELLPPVGWADVATKHDLMHLETVMNMRFEAADARMEGFEVRLEDLAREIRTLPWKLTTLMVAVVGVVIAGIRL